MSDKDKTKAEKPKRKHTGVPLLIWDVDPGLRTKFRAACVSKGTTMRREVIAFIKRYTS